MRVPGLRAKFNPKLSFVEILFKFKIILKTFYISKNTSLDQMDHSIVLVSNSILGVKQRHKVKTHLCFAIKSLMEKRRCGLCLPGYLQCTGIFGFTEILSHLKMISINHINTQTATP